MPGLQAIELIRSVFRSFSRSPEELVRVPLTKQEKTRIEKAAAMHGMTVEVFVSMSAQVIASIDEAKMINLGPEDSRRVAEALINPGEPTPELREAVRRYWEMLAPGSAD